MKITEDSVPQSVAEKDSLQSEMSDKSSGFMEAGTEVYAKSKFTGIAKSEA
jgi:hypothetical protein